MAQALIHYRFYFRPLLLKDVLGHRNSANMVKIASPIFIVIETSSHTIINNVLAGLNYWKMDHLKELIQQLHITVVTGKSLVLWSVWRLMRFQSRAQKDEDGEAVEEGGVRRWWSAQAEA